uniref:Uncharacterized protein n=1 Tax=Leersia perrieri TaxID=77586 RepID=A0A0D9XU30_9ORYZ
MVEAQEWLDRFKLDGRTREAVAFSNLLEKSQVISIWGFAGVGKSVFVRRSYYLKIEETANYYKKIEEAADYYNEIQEAVNYEQKIQEATDYYWKIQEVADFDRYGWVDVSHPFDLMDFSRSLLLDLCPELRQAEENADDFCISGVKDPIKECHGFLRDQRCLVVIDGLRSTEEWDLIKDNMANGPLASSIIVVTNEAKVVLKKNPNFNVDIIDKELILKCGGLPKVINAAAGLLANKTIESDWGKIVKSMNSGFMVELETNPGVDSSIHDLFGWMHTYLFQTCPDYLRPCILYLSSIFPGYYSIRRRRLIMRWVAEGYSKDTNNHTADENGEKFFSKLVELDMVQHPPESATTVFSDTRMVLCQVNAFLHEYVISRPLEDNFTLALEVFTLNEDSCRPTTRRRGRHLVIEESWDRDKIVFDSIDFSRLRSLTVFGKWESYFVSENMRLIRVLDLEGITSGLEDDDLEKLMKLLCRLKFLSLRGCKDIHHLPRSCRHLRQLQTLDIRHTSIDMLPSAITKLPKLQYLRAGRAGSQWTPSTRDHKPHPRTTTTTSRHRSAAAGVKVPAGINQLTALHTLGVINASALCGKAILEELKELTQLRKLGVSGINRINSKKFSSAISALKYLESLSVWLSKCNRKGCLDGISCPPRKLQSLKLYYGHVDRLPVWINQLDSLRKLDLDMIMLTQEDMHLLGDLQLCILRLCLNPRVGEQLRFSVRPGDAESNQPRGLGFPNLEIRDCLQFHVITCTF